MRRNLRLGLAIAMSWAVASSCTVRDVTLDPEQGEQPDSSSRGGGGPDAELDGAGGTVGEDAEASADAVGGADASGADGQDPDASAEADSPDEGAEDVGGPDTADDVEQVESGPDVVDDVVTTDGGAAGEGGASGQGGAAGEGGAATGGSSTGGMNTGGMNTGGMNTGGMNTGGMNTGGMNTGGSGTGGALGETLCMDQLDNDSDGAKDCADSECTGSHKCTPSLPSGWLSIGYLNPTNASAPCPVGYPSRINLKNPAALPTTPQTCACSCSNAGAICTSVASCGNDCTSLSSQSFSIGELCDPFGNGAALICKFSSPVPVGGSCFKSFTLPALNWPATGRICHRGPDLGYGSCPNANSVCVPNSAGDLGPCVMKSGEVACPGAPYTDRHVLSDGTVNDQRQCVDKDCACGDTIGGTCLGGNQVYLYTDDKCSSSTMITIPADGQCVSISGEYVGANVAAYLGGGAPTCQVTGSGITTGSVTPSMLTICCAP